MLCLNCGKEISGDSIYCQHCGQKTYLPKQYRSPADLDGDERDSPGKVQQSAGGTAVVKPKERTVPIRTLPVRPQIHAVDLFHSPKRRGIAALLCLFLGVLGIHRFYVGKIGTGFLWLLTYGLFGVGVIVDLFCILCGNFKDRDGRRLARW